MGAYHNCLREEGSRSELLTALEKAWGETVAAEVEIERLEGLTCEPTCAAPQMALEIERLHKIETAAREVFSDSGAIKPYAVEALEKLLRGLNV